MTTEEMNRDIAEYMGFVTGSYPGPNSPVTQFPTGDAILLIDKKLIELISDEDYATWKGVHTKFDTSWDWLMPVWQKLRGELDDLSVDEYGMVKDSDYIVSKHAIEKSILSCDLPTAHKLIHEAITLIKK